VEKMWWETELLPRAVLAALILSAVEKINLSLGNNTKVYVHLSADKLGKLDPDGLLRCLGVERGRHCDGVETERAYINAVVKYRCGRGR
jgi:hypothetical protein